MTEILRRSAAGTLLACLALASSGCLTVQFFGGAREPLIETVIYGESGPKIALIDIDGVISEQAEDSQIFEPPEEGMLARVREQLDHARDDASVKALLLRIDSPGGSVTASDILHQEVMRFKRERGIPWCALHGRAASGAYTCDGRGRCDRAADHRPGSTASSSSGSTSPA